jgi:nicotinamidase-related amidase
MRRALVILDLARHCGVRAFPGWDEATVRSAIEDPRDGSRAGYDVIVSVIEPAPDAYAGTHHASPWDATFVVDDPATDRSAFLAVEADGWLLGSYLSRHDVREVDIAGIAPASFLVETALECAYRFFTTRVLTDVSSSPAAVGAASKRFELAGVKLVTRTEVVVEVA